MVLRILLAGKTARADCVAEAFSRSPQKPELYSLMDIENPGVKAKSREFTVLDLMDFEKVKDYAKKVKPDFAFLGPDDPIAAGIADALTEAGVPSVGPNKNLARIESSKSFCRQLLEKHGIDANPKFRIFHTMNGVKNSMEEFGEFVVKPDGLTGGKGVKVKGDHFQTNEEAISYCEDLFARGDKRLLIEEKLVGEEFSLQSLSDGKHLMHFPPVQDHKRAFEGDEGPNTGGMGSYSSEKGLLPFMKEEHLAKAKEFNEKTIKALKDELGQEFKGVLYGGFIITSKGVKLIEYNARFGDPEIMNVLPLMKTDFAEVCKRVLDRTIDEIEVEFEPLAAVLKYVAPEGYPTAPVKGESVDLSALSEGARVYFGAVEETAPNTFRMLGSRAIACLGIGESLEEAERKAQKTAESVKGKVFFRKDIGTKELIQKKVEHVNSL